MVAPMPEALRRLERVGVVGLCCSTFCLLVFVGASVVGVQFINYDAGVRLRMLTLTTRTYERTNTRTHERTPTHTSIPAHSARSRPRGV